MSVNRRKILYIQFTDPAAYPPLEHSSRILAERGWEVLFLGTGMSGGAKLAFPAHPRIRVRRIGIYRRGWRQKVQYAVFLLWTSYWVARWRPAWIYASDPLVCPIARLIQKLGLSKVVYHEHDSPDPDSTKSRFMTQVLRQRKSLGGNSEISILPQRERVRQFIEVTQRVGPTFCVWNCPRLEEVIESNTDGGDRLIIYYHGTITPARVPAQLIIAASRFKGAVQIRVAGYETLGSVGYLRELSALAARNGASGIVDALGTKLTRADILRSASRAHVGLSLIPKQSKDINMRYMVGASNKPFDYMASALPLLVSDLPDWVAAFADPGYARACDPDDADSIEAELRWYLEHPDERAQMGCRGQERIRQAWNYDRMFAGVIKVLDDS